MAACGAVARDAIEGYCVLGELALDGAISPVSGVLPAAIGANALGKGLICPKACGAEAAWASEDMNLLAPVNLLALINHFKGLQTLSRPEPALEEEPRDLPDFIDIKGQESAKRTLEVAAAGGHNLLMIGPPGAGKSMLARRLPSILPPLTPAELLEVSMVHIPWRARFRAACWGVTARSARRIIPPPWRRLSAAAPGPDPVKPRLPITGFFSLMSCPSFPRRCSMPCASRWRPEKPSSRAANHRIVYPSRVQLIAAMNPCRCGRAVEPGFACGQGKNCAARYQSRISGPLLDRIDLQIEVPTLTAADLIMPASCEGNAAVRERVNAARAIQSERFAALEKKNIRPRGC